MTPARGVAPGQVRTSGPEIEPLWEISIVFHPWPQDGRRSEKNGHEDSGTAAAAQACHTHVTHTDLLRTVAHKAA